LTFANSSLSRFAAKGRRVRAYLAPAAI
jgi:hypothetical protein